MPGHRTRSGFLVLLAGLAVLTVLGTAACDGSDAQPSGSTPGSSAAAADYPADFPANERTLVDALSQTWPVVGAPYLEDRNVVEVWGYDESAQVSEAIKEAIRAEALAIVAELPDHSDADVEVSVVDSVELVLLAQLRGVWPVSGIAYLADRSVFVISVYDASGEVSEATQEAIRAQALAIVGDLPRYREADVEIDVTDRVNSLG